MDIYSLHAAKFMTKKVITAKINSTVRSVCKSVYDNNVSTNLFPKEDFDTSLSPKKKPKSQGGAKVLNFGRGYNI